MIAMEDDDVPRRIPVNRFPPESDTAPVEEAPQASAPLAPFPMYVFSWLRGKRLPSGHRELILAPGLVEWKIASPVPGFLEYCADMLASQDTLQVGPLEIPIYHVSPQETPPLGEVAHFTCLSPIVAGGQDRDNQDYLLPSEPQAFSEAVRLNLLRKHRQLHGRAPADQRFVLRFKHEYMKRGAHSGVKMMHFQGSTVIGAYAPFTAYGSPELIRVGIECGFGERNSAGFGMVDIRA